MARRDERDSLDREILDIIPERFDADADSREARRGAHTRLVLSVALGLLAVAALGVAARHLFFGEAPQQTQASIPVINPEDKPIKTKPQESGGMDVPNQDKLVYNKIGQGDSTPQPEQLLPPPEEPRTPTIKPAFQAPASDAAAQPQQAAAPAAQTAPAAPSATTAAAAPQVPTAPVPAAAPQAGQNDGAIVPPDLPAAKRPADSKVAEAKVAEAKPPTDIKPASEAKSAAGGGWMVQLGALHSEADASAEWKRLQAADKELLGSLGSDIERADLGAKGVFWRLRAGPLDEVAARSLCAQLAKRNQGCILARK